jgi:predicted dehydrogenase
MPVVTVGAGSIVVDAHFPAYRKGGFPIAGVFDLNAERAKMVGEKVGVRVFESLDEALVTEGQRASLFKGLSVKNCPICRYYTI